MAGIAAMMAWEQEDIRVMQTGESLDIAGYTLRLDDVRQKDGPNYVSTEAEFTLSQNGREIGTMQPEKRNYPVAQMPTTEAALNNGFLRDIYVVIGDPQNNGGWAVRTYYKPLANWIWGGTIIMALGGVFSLSDRRYRVAAGTRHASSPARGAPEVPAE